MDSSSPSRESEWLAAIVRQLAAEAENGNQPSPAEGEPLDRVTVRRIYDLVAGAAHIDKVRAAELAALAARLADHLDDDVSRGLARKAAGFLRYLDGEYEEARQLFTESAELFGSEGEEVERAATLSTSVHTLSYLGRYEEAHAAVVTARRIFEAHDEQLKLARLDTNEGNILFRQERIAEAQTRYRSALERLRQLGAPPRDIAAAMHNIVTCGIALHDFEGSLGIYDELIRLCDLHDMGPVAAQAEYNIAYLYFLRGDYDRALELYRDARRRARAAGDRYHRALCDLDQAEMLLELNLPNEAERLAAQALTAFEKLGLGYEAAKAICFRALAANQQGKPIDALDLFRQGRERFQSEGNEAWVSIIDLYQAVIYHDEQRTLEARKLALSALEFFESNRLASKTLICELLLARVDLQSGDLGEARRRATAAVKRATALDRPALSFRAQLVAAEVAEAESKLDEARWRLETAAELLEDLRAHLRGEELKLAFLRDKTTVYEQLVWLTMTRPLSAADRESIFLNMERAKSRILADMVSFRTPQLPAAASGSSRLVNQMQQLRNELNWYYRQIDLAEFPATSGDSGAAPGNGTELSTQKNLDGLHEESRHREDQLIARLTELRATNNEFGSLHTAEVLGLEEVRQRLPKGTMVLEYFVARDMVFCCCLGNTTLEVVALTPTTLVREHQQRLSFQLGKFRLGDEYTRRFADTLRRSTRSHLQALHQELVAPLRRHLDADHLVIVPHGSLHGLPFHAFFGDDGYLIDHFSISYAPSANVYALCAGRDRSAQAGSLVLGVPTADTPGIRDEAEAVAATLPHAQLFLEEEATDQRLRDEGARARLVHIATHGLFREDNPMFSSIQLGASRLTLFDLYGLELDADLVVLSGCSTGIGVVEGGDELIGLSRGLLYAGARSVMASLWDVHDESAVALMSSFYRSLLKSGRAERALGDAMREVQKSYPHPYHWAPFVLVGQFPAGG